VCDVLNYILRRHKFHNCNDIVEVRDAVHALLQ
jgi:hypothetical protein